MGLRRKKVLITGADGFIGSHMAEALVKEGAAVRAFVYYNSFNSFGWLDALPSRILRKIEVFSGDIRDPNGVRTAMQGAHTVFHLAALIGNPFSYHSPDSYIDTNVKGTLNILQAARALGTERILVTSTSEVYGTAKYSPMDESHPLQGQSPYSASKIGADKLAEAFHLSFQLPVVTVRPFNTYGPRQSARAIIPTIITQLLNGADTIRLGSLEPTRDFNYVSDTCAGFMYLAGCDAALGQTVNIGSGRDISIGALAEKIMSLTGKKAVILCDRARKRPIASEVERLVCDNSRIRALTGWSPVYTLEKGLAATIDWFRSKENLVKYRWDAYNV